MNYADLMEDLRKDKGETQEDIAHILGISRSTYKDYETESTVIPIKHLISIANYYNVSIDYLFGFTTHERYTKTTKEIDKLKAGERLKEFRKTKNLTQKDLASILNTTFSSIAWYEKGRNLIATPFLYTICKNYNISADYLLGRIDRKVVLK